MSFSIRCFAVLCPALLIRVQASAAADDVAPQGTLGRRAAASLAAPPARGLRSAPAASGAEEEPRLAAWRTPVAAAAPAGEEVEEWSTTFWASWGEEDEEDAEEKNFDEEEPESTTVDEPESTTVDKEDETKEAASTTEGMDVATTTVAVPDISGSLIVQGISYSQLNAKPELEAAVIESCRNSVADEAGAKVRAEDVACTLSEGSVRVSFTINVQEGVDVLALVEGLNSTSLGHAILREVEAVPGIDAVTTGPLTVSGLSVTAGQSPATSSTTASWTTTLEEAEGSESNGASRLAALAMTQVVCLLSVFAAVTRGMMLG